MKWIWPVFAAVGSVVLALLIGAPLIAHWIEVVVEFWGLI